MSRPSMQDHVFYKHFFKPYPVVSHGQGVYLYDREGKRYLDASGGPVVVNIGHGVPEVAEAIAEQARRVGYVSSYQFTSEAQIELAELVIGLAPPGMDKAYFVSGGSEAVEVAIKMVRHYHLARGQPERTKMIGRWQSYHGASFGALSVSGHVSRREDYLPYLLNFPHIHAPFCSRCPLGLSYPQCRQQCAEDLERTIRQEGAHSIAAFFAEPFLGNSAGAVVPPPEYYPRIREICDAYGILLVIDEVMTGFGRTGRNFGIDHWAVVPDIITTGKGISSGYAPLGAVLLHEKVMRGLMAGDPPRGFTRAGSLLGYTYSGHPVSCAAGVAVQRYLQRHQLIERSAKLGEYLFERMGAALRDAPMVGDVRGKGLFMGIELVEDRQARRPFPRSLDAAGTVAAALFERGIIVMAGHGGIDGVLGDHFVISPPFVITESEIDWLAREVRACLDEQWRALRAGAAGQGRV